MGLVFHLICLFLHCLYYKVMSAAGFTQGNTGCCRWFRADCIEQFYRITYYVTGEAKTLRILTDLLAIHMLYLMIHYVGDL